MRRYNLSGFVDTVGGWIDVIALLCYFTGHRWRLAGGGDDCVYFDPPPPLYSLDWEW